MNEEELKKALKEGSLFDYIANNYHDASKWELKEIILAILGVVYDNRASDEDYDAFQKKVLEELHNRSFFDEDYSDEGVPLP